MQDSHVIARKFRPQTFEQVIGQDAISRTLRNSLKNNRIHHAYLFTGPRGVGKTTTARILAKSLNCATGLTTTPCDACPSCIEIAMSRSIDVLEIDAASNTGVDNVREVIINSITISPARDRHKIFIIDEVHMLSTPAFNALLKTIEEPPPRVVFILATTELGKVPDTILSRCQVFEFRAITLKNIVGELRRIAAAENITITETALLAIARAAEGSMRDAESALDQVISFAGTTIGDDDVSGALGLVDLETLNETIQAIGDQDSERLLRMVEGIVSRGYDLRNFCRELMVHIRALLVVKIAGFDAELVQLPETEATSLKSLGESFSEQDLLRFFSILTKTEQDIRFSSQPRFQLELALVKMAQSRRLHLLEDAIARISELESRLGGAPAHRSPAPQAYSGPARSSSPTRTTSSAPASQSPSRQSTPARPQAQAGKPASSAESKPSAIAGAVARPAPQSASGQAAPPEPAKPPATTDRTPQPRASGGTDADRIKGALEAKRKNIIVAHLDKGAISIDGDYLRVSYAPEDAKCKTDIETRDKRIAIEDACEEAFGRRLTLRASIAGEPEPAGPPRRKENPKGPADDNPKLQALADKFHGEIIEVIKPDN
jgi:DNA polymerase-3 subunit gamma/tau